jgi:hypothetical protein
MPVAFRFQFAFFNRNFFPEFDRKTEGQEKDGLWAKLRLSARQHTGKQCYRKQSCLGSNLGFCDSSIFQ